MSGFPSTHGAIIKIARKSIGIPAETGISEIDWDVTLAPGRFERQ